MQDSIKTNYELDEADLKANVPGYIPFSDIPINTATIMIQFEKGTNINFKKVFKWCKITQTDNYTYIGNSKKVNFTYLIEPGSIVAAKYGKYKEGVKNYRGIQKGSLNAFPNQVSLDICLKEKYVNVFLYANSMKITGCKKYIQIQETFEYVLSQLIHIQKYHKVQVYNTQPVIDTVVTEMGSISFNLGHEIDLNLLSIYISDRWGFTMYYDPMISSKLATISYTTEHRKKNKDLVYHSFEVRTNGKVRYTGRQYMGVEIEISYKRFRYIIAEAIITAQIHNKDITIPKPQKHNKQISDTKRIIDLSSFN